ncbi:MAG: hypothetical protein CL677_03700 [Bdellovibrionaceae bacterium]|nr:hypothetical protein [Pseudobdellovibrionaceae bacterium]
MKLPKVIIVVLVFSVAGSIFLSAGEKPKHAFLQVCYFVSQKYYKVDQELIEWERFCKDVGSSIPLFISEEEMVKALRQVMSYLPVSHLDIYSPSEEKRAWKGIGTDTGLRVQLVEDYFVVTQILEGSPLVGKIKKGDVIYKIGEDYVQHSEEVGPARQTLTVLRLKPGLSKKQDFVRDDFDSFLVEPSQSEISVDPANKVYSYKNLTVLQLGSFKPEMYKQEDWMNLVNQFIDKPKLVVDLRGNLGGDFAALLRGLSPFFCKPTLIGYIKAPRRPAMEPMVFPDTLVSEKQFEILEVAKEVMLSTFENYGCFRGELSVLVDHNTGSSAEIFAQAILEKGTGRVWGQPTKGEVVLSIWYDLSFILGKGYSISIPEASYVTTRGLDLERVGVLPEKELYYELKHELFGRDSWLEALR